MQRRGPSTGTQSFYSSSRRPNAAQSLVCGTPRGRSQPQRRALQPIQANADHPTPGYLPGMSLSDLASSMVRDERLEMKVYLHSTAIALLIHLKMNQPHHEPHHKAGFPQEQVLVQVMEV